MLRCRGSRRSRRMKIKPFQRHLADDLDPEAASERGRRGSRRAPRRLERPTRAHCVRQPGSASVGTTIVEIRAARARVSGGDRARSRSRKKPGTGRRSGRRGEAHALVAVGLPDHHGVGVGGLAGGDGGGLVEDGGDGGESGHFDCWLLVCVVFVQL